MLKVRWYVCCPWAVLQVNGYFAIHEWCTCMTGFEKSKWCCKWCWYSFSKLWFYSFASKFKIVDVIAFMNIQYEWWVFVLFLPSVGLSQVEELLTSCINYSLYNKFEKLLIMLNPQRLASLYLVHILIIKLICYATITPNSTQLNNTQ